MAKSKHKQKDKRDSSIQPRSLPAIDKESAQEFSARVLTPIINEYLARLHSTILAASSQGATSLFCYRAGLRILLLYRAWLAARNEELSPSVDTFKISRIAALKAAYKAAPQLCLAGIGSLLANHDLHDIVEAILGENLKLKEGRLPAMPLQEFMASNTPIAERLRSYLLQQSELMRMYVAKLAGDARRILLVDSGWAGTTQLVLEQSLPECSFDGAYFGVIGRTELLGMKPGRMHGLMFENADFSYDPSRPESVHVLHRHLIESLFEPDIKSISQLSSEDLGGKAAPVSESVLCRPSCDWDRMFTYVLADIRHQATQLPTTRLTNYKLALQRLGENLVYPTRDTVMLAVGKYRSADLGRSIGVDPLLPPGNRFAGDSPERRIADSLWPAGQAALEFADPRVVQERILAANLAVPQQNYFVSSTDTSLEDVGDKKVAVITRTKNRPILLQRAATSVARQSYLNIEWVVVNDGGNLADVREVIANSLADPSRVTICHNPSSLGMEAASNAGIRNSESEWLVIHDDDDSWHPDFLAEATAFLRKNRGLYSGVITGTMYITEEIVGDKVIEHGRVPYQDWVKSVQLAEMATGNFFAPIAFVFERRIYDTVGGFDAKLPVLGDWDFNLRFLLEADIGVLDKPLAYYHHRISTTGGAYSNSVVGGIDKHLSYNAIVRNKYMREAISNPKMGALANLMSVAYLHIDSRSRLDTITRTVGNGTSANREDSGQDMQSRLDERWILLCFLAGKLEEVSGGKISKNDVLKLDRAAALRILNSVDIPAPPDFDEEQYLSLYKDVADLVSQGLLRSGFSHYFRFGRGEGRAVKRTH